jgi:hypothetical protein
MLASLMLGEPTAIASSPFAPDRASLVNSLAGTV